MQKMEPVSRQKKCVLGIFPKFQKVWDIPTRKFVATPGNSMRTTREGFTNALARLRRDESAFLPLARLRREDGNE